MAAAVHKELNAFVASIKATPTMLSKIIVSESVNGSFNASYSKSHFCIGMCFVQGCITLVGFFYFYVSLIVFGACLSCIFTVLHWELPCLTSLCCHVQGLMESAQLQTSLRSYKGVYHLQTAKQGQFK